MITCASFGSCTPSASRRQISGASYKKPFTTQGPAAGWVGETEVRAETAGPQLSEIEFPAMELYAMPAATSTLLDDGAIDIDQWLAEEVQTTFAEQEGAAFVNGDGIRRPRGFLSYGKVAKFLAIDAQYGGYVSFACRWVPYGARERPLRTLY